MFLGWESLWILEMIERFQRVEMEMKERFQRVELEMKERVGELLHCWNLELGRELSNWMEVGGERKCWTGSLAEAV